MEVLAVFAAAAGTAVATGAGVIPVIVLRDGAIEIRSALAGLAVGAMTVAAIAGLLIPAARDGSAAAVAGGSIFGVVFVVAARETLGAERYRERVGVRARRSLLVFGVLLVHSLPEGLAIGAAWSSDTAGLGLFVVLAIALQNVPEGTAIAIPMDGAGYPVRRQVWAAIASSLPQPVGAVGAYVLVEEVRSVLPLSLAFAGGAMLAVVVIELVPEALTCNRVGAAIGTLAGGLAMLALSLALGI